MSSVRLTETSYIVLGLLEQAEPATPYDLKQFAQISVFNFWSIPHTQIYTECQRLAEAGLLRERRESDGRRRRFYKLTAEGRKALEAWRAEPTDQLYEARDAGTLKLFFGGDPAVLASSQLEAHRAKLREYEQISRDNPEMPRGMRLALEAGIGHEREFIRFWSRLATAKAAKPGSS
jgi:PadR family transcriptional regulator AphA